MKAHIGLNLDELTFTQGLAVAQKLMIPGELGWLRVWTPIPIGAETTVWQIQGSAVDGETIFSDTPKRFARFVGQYVMFFGVPVQGAETPGHPSFYIRERESDRLIAISRWLGEASSIWPLGWFRMHWMTGPPRVARIQRFGTWPMTITEDKREEYQARELLCLPGASPEVGAATPSLMQEPAPAMMDGCRAEDALESSQGDAVSEKAAELLKLYEEFKGRKLTEVLAAERLMVEVRHVARLKKKLRSAGLLSHSRRSKPN